MVQSLKNTVAINNDTLIEYPVLTTKKQLKKVSYKAKIYSVCIIMHL